jgi:hypothetical protein
MQAICQMLVSMAIAWRRLLIEMKILALIVINIRLQHHSKFHKPSTSGAAATL